MKREKSCGVIVFHKNEFLLLHYPSGHWDFPKGHVEKGEKEEDTAMREAKEETGLDVEILPGFKETMKYFFKDKQGLVRKEVVFFLAESKDREVTLSKEHRGFVWLPFNEATEKVTYKNAKEILKKADEFLLKSQ